VAVALVAVPVLFDVLVAFDPAPYPPPYQHVAHPFPTPPEPYLTIITVAALALLPALLGLLFAAAAGMVVRYRREPDPVRRAQVKWFALGGLFLPGTLLLCWVSYLFTGDADLVVFGLAATFLAIPIATAIAILRHDLYDVDRAISAAVTYGIVTVALLGFYTVAAFLVGLAAGRGSAIAAAAATAICAAALAPLRARLQRGVDRRLYPARRAALGAIEDLRRRTHAGTASPEELVPVLRSALRDPELRVGYRLPGSDGLVDADGAPLDPGGAYCAPVRLGGQEIGVLVRGSTGTRELLREVAAACTLLIEVVRLRVELGSALRDAESSRSRLLQVGYRERRRLERDLHDGAQQRLVSLGMAIRLAQRHLDDGTVDVNGLLDQSVAELGTAVAELRQIAHGLRPSSLDDGLAPALTALVGSVPLPVTLTVCPDELPDDVATTAYYVVSEAVVNAVKHAEAGAIGLTVARLDGRLTVQVSDDGLGGARMRPGAGLAGLADRVAAAGGALNLSSPRGRGTVVEAVLPCAS
jgi:signal transduction histidine kinase